MRGQKRSRGLTMIEVAVVIVVIAVLVAILIPAVQWAREEARRGACNSNFKQIGTAFHNYHDAHKQFPPASGVTRDADGKITAVDGWSWVVRLLPQMDLQSLFDGLDVEGGRPLAEPLRAKGTPHADALAAWHGDEVPRFYDSILRCPTFRGSPYSDPVTKKAVITNYKMMGATHIESLSAASPNPLKPKYDPTLLPSDKPSATFSSSNLLSTWHVPTPLPSSKPSGGSLPPHPDGAGIPGTALKISDFTDGTSHTILVAETLEQRFARWTVGAETILVGLPPVVEFEPFPRNLKLGIYYAPKGFDGDFGDNSKVDPTYRTYLKWDYDKHPYDGADGTIGGKYGPSSHHPSGINHLMADGSVRIFTRDMDVAAYMFMITRSSGDPFWMPRDY